MSDFTFKDNSGLFLALLKNREAMIAEAIGDKMEGYAKDTINTFQHNGKTGYIDTGTAEKSINNTYEVKENEIIIYVGSNVEYFVYLEVGTGIYASDGKGRKGWWVYVKNGNKKAKSKKPYTEAEAKRVAEILRSKGLEAFATNGIQPSHALQKSIADHVDEYKQIAADGLKGILS